MGSTSQSIIVKLLHVVTTVSLVFGLSPMAGRAVASPATRSDRQPLQHAPAELSSSSSDADPALQASSRDLLNLSDSFLEQAATTEPSTLQAELAYSRTLFLPLVIQTRDAGPKAEVVLQKWTEPWLALPGDVVTYTLVVANTGGLTVPDGVLVDHVPQQLMVLSAQGSTQDAESGELRWNVGPLDPGHVMTVTFQARVAGGTEMTMVQNNATFAADPDSATGVPWVTAVATATLLVGEATMATLTSAGGELASPDGRIHLAAPPGAVTQPTDVRLANFPLPKWEPGQPRWMALFDVQAMGETGLALQDGAHTRFLRPLTVTLDLGGRIGWMDAYLLHCEDLACRELRPMPSQFDGETDVLTAALQTFSGNGAVGRNPFPTDGSYFLFQNWPGSDLYSGGLSYGIPIAAPAGAGGLGPSLSLNYSSRGLDGVMGVVQSPSVGVGWSLGGVAQVVREIKTHLERGDPYVETAWEFKNDFTLMVNATSYKLVWGEKLDPGPGCLYYTKERSGLRVVRYNALCGYEDSRPGNETGEYWIVRTPDGTRYQFGTTANSEQVVNMNQYNPAKCSLHDCDGGYWHRFDSYAGDGIGLVASRWSVDRVEDLHGNTMTYHYHEERWDRPANALAFDRAVYLHHVEYGGNVLTGTPMRYRLEIDLVERRDESGDGRGAWHDAGPPIRLRYAFSQWENLRVRAVRVCLGTDACSHVIREYVLDYDTPTLEHPGAEWGRYGDERPELTVLRAVRQYGRGGEVGGQALPPIVLHYDNLDQADREDDPTSGGLEGGKLRYPRLVRVENGYGGWASFEYEQLMDAHVYSYRVSQQQQGDGLGRVAKTTYAYDGPCFAGTKAASSCRRDQPENHTLLGHQWVEETVYTYDDETVLARIKHYFHRDREEALGREHRTEVWGSGAAAPLQVVTSTWAMTSTYGGIDERYNIELKASETCLDGTCNRTEYDYDGYGNILAEYALGDTNVAGDERTARTRYVYNTDAWIVGLPTTQTMYEGIVTTDVQEQAKARQYFYYDGQTHDQQPALGELTRVDVWQLGGPYTTIYEYDDWGNQTVVTDALDRRSVTTYDDVYRQFPVRACNALNQCGYTEYYGVNAGLDVEGASFGAVYRAWGPNGPDTATHTRYDAFGRVRAVRLPGDSWAYPTTLFEYHDGPGNGLPAGMWAVARQREESGQPGTLDYAVYHDGLGRLIQTSAEIEEGWSASSQGYDALGRVVRGYLPQFQSDSGYTSPDGEYTETEYDVLGRAVKVTNPDQTYAETRYNGRTTTAIDANRHQRAYVNDAFGQLVRVEEYTGTVGSDLGLYATTRYAYDVLGNLVAVTDTNGVATTMTYDDLGRKEAMDDPDMGRWKYVYDLLGNLEWQEDAKGQRIEFEYDDLSRLVRKQEVEGEILAVYRYDEPGHGYSIGQRTSMVYPGGSAFYHYDERGRVVTQTHTIQLTNQPTSQLTNQLTYHTTYTYDTMDRVRTMTYPDGERVTQTYDGGGLPDALSSSLGESFVKRTRYNAAGQITHITLGNDLQTTYGYNNLTMRLAWLKTGTQAKPDLHQWLTYQYDDVGNVRVITDEVLDEEQAFAYDPLDRLVKADAQGLDDARYARVYGYDPTGNIDWRVNEGQYIDYEYNGPAPHAVTDLSGPLTGLGQVGSHFEYDANGNMTLRVEISATRTITYVQRFDVENRLVQVTTLSSDPATNSPISQTTTFGYDGDGVRVWQTTGEGTTIYVGEYYEEFWPGAIVGQDSILSLSQAAESVEERRTVAGQGIDAVSTLRGINAPSGAGKRGVTTLAVRAKPERPHADGTLAVSVSGDFEIEILESHRGCDGYGRLDLRSPQYARLFSDDVYDAPVKAVESKYFAAGQSIVLWFYHYENSGDVCGSAPNPVRMDVSASENAHFAVHTLGTDYWQIEFDDQSISTVQRELWIEIRRINALVKPTWVSTGDSCTVDTDRTVTWNATDGWWYQVQRATDPAFTQNAVSVDVQADGDTASHTFTGHTTDTYYYRVQGRGLYNTDASAWSVTATRSHDRSAPTSSHALAGTQGSNNWYTGPVQVTLSADDPGCGSLASIHHDYGGGQTYGGPFTVSPNGSHTVQYYAVDSLENTETTRSVSFSIDASRPASWTGFSPTGWVGDPTPNAAIRVRDLTSGLDVSTAQYRYSKDGGGDWSPWDSASCTGADGTSAYQTITAQNIPFNQSSATQNRVQFRVRDMAGTWGQSGQYTVKVDINAPTNPHRPANPGCDAQDDVWQNTCADPNFTWSGATDAHSGVQDYYVYWGTSSSGTSTEYTSDASYDPPAVDDSDTYYLRVRTRDNVGNLATWKTIFALRYDTDPPTNPTRPADPHCQATDGVWQRTCKDPDFTWSGASDGHSGVSGYYIYWGNNPNGTSTIQISSPAYNPSAVNGSGTYYLRVCALDSAGNLACNQAEEWQTLFALLYDGSPPTNPNRPADPGCDAQDGVWQNTCADPDFTWSGAGDAHSGVKGYYIYWGNNPNGTSAEYATDAGYDPPAVDSSDTYYLRVRTRDVVGNLAKEWQTLFALRYDSDPPTNPTRPADPGCDAQDGVWQRTCDDPDFTWSGASDAPSGVKGYYVYWGTSSSGTSSKFVTSAAYNPPAVNGSGTYYLRVRTRDNANNRAAWKTLFALRYDGSPPTNPTRPANPGCGAQDNVWQKTCNDPSFAWSGASDGHSRVKGYYVYWGTSSSGTSSTFITSAAYNPPAVDGSSTYYLRVRTRDNAGNSAGGAVEEWQTLFALRYDSDPPTNPVRPADPHCPAADGIWQNTCADPNFTWSGASDAHSGVKGYYVYWGTSASGTSSTFVTSAAYNPPAVDGSGTYYLRVRTRDAVGNVATWKTLFVLRYDATAPANPSRPADPGCDAQDGVWQNTCNDPDFTWSGASDAHSGVKGYYVYWGTSFSGTSSNLVTSAAYNPPAVNGSSTYYLRVRARDNAGNRAAWKTLFALRYDSDPPTTPTRPANPGCTATDNVWQNTCANPNFTWSGASDAHSGVKGYNVYWGTNSSGTSSTFVSSAAYNPPAVGSGTVYYLRVRTRDDADNTAAWKTLFVLRYDGTPPSGWASFQPTGWVTDNTPNASASVSDAASGLNPATARYRYSTDGGTTWNGAWLAASCTGSAGTTAPQTCTASNVPFQQDSDALNAVQFQIRDVAGNLRRSPVYTVKADAHAPQIGSLQATPYLFSPNGNGRRETTHVTAVIDEPYPAAWTVTVLGTVPLASHAGSGNSVSWTWDGSGNQGDGDYDVAITATDLAGNTTTVDDGLTIRLDTTPPPIPSVHWPGDVGQGWPDGTIYHTNQDGVLVQGWRDGSVKAVRVNGALAALTTYQGQPWYQYTLSGLPVGQEEAVRIVAEDEAGNRSSPLVRTVLYDTGAPIVGAWGPTGTVGSVQPLVWAAFESQGSPVLPHTVAITLDGALDVTAQAVITPGGFTLTPATSLAEGTLHSVAVALSDAAGNRADRTWFFAVDGSTWVEILAPPQGAVLNRLSITVTGQTEPGSVIPGALVDALGAFTLTNVALATGVNVIEVTAVDAWGHTATDAVTLTVDTDRPSASVTIEPNPFSPDGDGVQDEAVFALQAAPPAGSSLQAWALHVGGQAMAAGDGPPPAAISWDGGGRDDGAYPYALVVTATNGLAAATAAQTVVIDTAPPGVPVITTPISPTHTDDVSVWVAGTAEPGSTVTLFNGGTFTFTALVDGTGAWGMLFPLNAGWNLLQATATDGSGHQSDRSGPVAVQLVVEPPLITVGITPTLATDGTLLDLWATARGVGHPAGPATRYVTTTMPTGEAIAMTNAIPAPEGLWAGLYTITKATANGLHPVEYEGVDRVGLRGEGRTALWVDWAPPAPPWLRQPTASGYTRRSALTVSGEAEPLARVRVHIGASAVGTTADANGQWGTEVTLTEGENHVWAKTWDLTGNRSAPSRVAVRVLDTVSPAVSVTALPFVRAGAGLTVRTAVADAHPVSQALLALPDVPGATEAAMTQQGGTWEATTILPQGTTEGAHTALVRAWDAAGNEGWAEATFVVDNTPPTGALRIEGGIAAVNRLTVMLALSATDTYTVTDMRLVNDGQGGINGQPWRPFSPALDWTLRDEDGLRAVYAQFRDRAGNESQVVSTTVELDRVPPSGSLSIDGGAPATNSRDVTLGLSSSDAAGMRASNDGKSWSAWEPYAASRAWTLPDADGAHTVYIQLVDAAGNESAAISDTIVLDRVPPSGSLRVDDDAPVTNSRDVHLALSASDAGSAVAGVRLCNDGGSWSAWKPYAAAKAWTLRDEDGTRTIYTQFRDLAGNESTVVSAGIVLDRVPPSGSLSIDDDAPATDDRAVVISLSSPDAVDVHLRNDGGGWSAWEPYAPSKPWTLRDEDGTRTVYIQFRDAAGNESAPIADTIELDRVPPSGGLSIDGGAAATNSRTVTLNLSSPDAVGVRFHNDGGSWSAWQTYAASKPWTLRDEDGTRTVYVQFRDLAGNESAVVSVGIELDRVPPTGSVSIDGGAAATSSRDVTLNLSSSDAVEMRLHNDDQSWSAWESYTAAKTWTLRDEDGTRTVYAQFRDLAGNKSAAVSAAIELDRTPPSGELSVDGGAAATNSRSVTLVLSASSAAEMSLRNDSGSWSAWEPYATSKAWTLRDEDGDRTVYARFRDAAGNQSAVVSAAILLDRVPPEANLYRLVESSPYAYVPPASDVVYYGAGSSGEFAVQVQGWDGDAGLAQARFPEITSAGGVQDVVLGGDYQYGHVYVFDPASTQEGAFQVVVVDGAANEGAAAFTVRRDAVPPVTTVSSPAYDPGGLIPVDWTAQDDPADHPSGLAGMQLWYRLDGSDWTPTAYTSTAASGTAYFTPPGEANGVYDFAAVGVDNVANVAPIAAAGHSATVFDTAAPQVTLALSESDPHAYVDGTTIYYGPFTGSFTVTASAQDATAGVESVTFPAAVSPGGSYAQAGARQATASHVYTFDPTNSFAGRVTVAAVDMAGHRHTARFTVARDATPPLLVLDVTRQGSELHVTWHASDPSAGSGLQACTLAVRQDDDDWQPLSSDCTGEAIHGEPGHQYTFRLQATDNVGNQAQTESQASVPVVTKYYYHGGQRIAMRSIAAMRSTAAVRSTAAARTTTAERSVVYYLHADHLGSTSLATYGSGPQVGQVASRQLYHPFGTTRYAAGSGGTAGTLPTDFGFTGQRTVYGTGLIFMHARYYHPTLGRFASADTIVPYPGSPQSLNRFAYVSNNP